MHLFWLVFFTITVRQNNCNVKIAGQNILSRYKIPRIKHSGMKTPQKTKEDWRESEW